MSSDVVVEIYPLGEFYKMQDKLLELGFKYDTSLPKGLFKKSSALLQTIPQRE